mmetsp:Transcript_62977/g.103965  ORF Transcript_62977/g.103965 Transcript_62977/m.103965 type:complete len:255 (+) Transcript_62977:1811-2575(+)
MEPSLRTMEPSGRMKFPSVVMMRPSGMTVVPSESLTHPVTPGSITVPFLSVTVPSGCLRDPSGNSTVPSEWMTMPLGSRRVVVEVSTVPGTVLWRPGSTRRLLLVLETKECCGDPRLLGLLRDSVTCVVVDILGKLGWRLMVVVTVSLRKLFGLCGLCPCRMLSYRVNSAGCGTWGVGSNPGGVYISPGCRGASGRSTDPLRIFREPSTISMEPSGRKTLPLGSFTDPSRCRTRSPGRSKSPFGLGSCHVPSGI